MTETKLLEPGSYKLLVLDAEEGIGRRKNLNVVRFDLLDENDQRVETRAWVGKQIDQDTWNFLRTHIGKIVYAYVVEKQATLKSGDVVTFNVCNFADSPAEVWT